jgi:hypothetical protein
MPEKKYSTNVLIDNKNTKEAFGHLEGDTINGRKLRKPFGL